MFLDSYDICRPSYCTAAVRASDSRPTRRPIVDRSARHGRPATVFREPQVQRRARDPEAPSSLCQVSIAGAHLGQNCLALSLTQIPRDRRLLFLAWDTAHR